MTALAVGAAVAVTTFCAVWRAAAMSPPARRLPETTASTRRVDGLERPGRLFDEMVAGVQRRRRERGESIAIADDLPDLVDLLAIAATAGGSVRRVVEAGAGQHAGPSGSVLRSAMAEVSGGLRLCDALDVATAGRAAGERDLVRPLVGVLLDADRYGTPLGPALDRLAADLRIHRQHRAETRARRVPVRLLLPLVCCVLPSFALLTVGPLLAGIARGALADHPSIQLELPEEQP